MEKKIVPNEVFTYAIYFDVCFGETVYVEPYKYTDEEVAKKYFTEDKINELKAKVIQKIVNEPNPFVINCVDEDGGYNITEEEIFKMED